MCKKIKGTEKQGMKIVSSFVNQTTMNKNVEYPVHLPFLVGTFKSTGQEKPFLALIFTWLFQDITLQRIHDNTLQIIYEVLHKLLKKGNKNIQRFERTCTVYEYISKR